MTKDISTQDYTKFLIKFITQIDEFYEEIGDAYDTSWTQEQIILCNLFDQQLRDAQRKGKWLLTRIKK
jgi:hypothetical protein